MSQSKDRQLLNSRIFLGIVLSMAFSNIGKAQPKMVCGRDPVEYSQRFLSAVYPALSGKKAFMELHSGGPFDSLWSVGTEFGVAVMQYKPDAVPGGIVASDGKAVEVKNEEIAGGLFICQSKNSGDIFLAKFSGGGTLTGRPRLERFVELCKSHSEWSDSQILDGLKNQGARFGPTERESFLAHARDNLHALEPFLGKLQLLTAEFQAHSGSKDEAVPELNWVLSIEAQRPSGVVRKYKLFYEPFQGDLFLITSQQDLRR